MHFGGVGGLGLECWCNTWICPFQKMVIIHCIEPKAVHSDIACPHYTYSTKEKASTTHTCIIYRIHIESWTRESLATWLFPWLVGVDRYFSRGGVSHFYSKYLWSIYSELKHIFKRSHFRTRVNIHLLFKYYVSKLGGGGGSRPVLILLTQGGGGVQNWRKPADVILEWSLIELFYLQSLSWK